MYTCSKERRRRQANTVFFDYRLEQQPTQSDKGDKVEKTTTKKKKKNMRSNMRAEMRMFDCLHMNYCGGTPDGRSELVHRVLASRSD